MNRTAHQPQSADSRLGRADQRLLDFFARPRRCDIDRLFEEWPLERVRLLKNREDVQSSVSQQAFQRELAPINICFHLNVAILFLAQDQYVDTFEDGFDALEGGDELASAVGAN